MKIGAMVGRMEDGTLEYLGKPGDVRALQLQANDIRSKGGVVSSGKSKKRYAEIIISDVTAHPYYRKKC
jgi:hypothetical protein